MPYDILVRLYDLAGRPRGAGFVADHHGTVLTGHEAVDGLPRLVLHAAGDRQCVVSADAVTPLPALGLALVRSEGLGVPPLPVTTRRSVPSGTYVRIPAGGWREARVLGTGAVTYTATDRTHLLGGALELAVGTAGRDALRLGGGAAGGPVLDATTGTVLGVLGTALRADDRDAGFAVPLPGRTEDGPLADLLAVNAATVPAYGADLNLAALAELTAAPAVTASVDRPAVRAELDAFERGGATVLGLVGPPGSGRTTQLAALAARRHRAGAPTLRLRGADLYADDGSVADAARRALNRAAAVVAASRVLFPAAPEALGDLSPEHLAGLARTEGRPLLLLLDGPEEVTLHRPAAWTAATARWLRATGARLVVACRAEYWEEAAYPAELLHTGAARADGQAAAEGLPHTGGLPACVAVGDLTVEEAREMRARHGIPEGAVADAGARHPLTLRMLAELRAAAAFDAPVDRDAVFSAHLDLMCLRIAVRLADESGVRGPPCAGWPPRPRGGCTRRPAAASAPGTASWTRPRSTRCSLTGPAGRPPSSPRGSSSRPGRPATGSPTRNWPTGSRAPTSTWTRRCTRWSTRTSTPGPPCPPRTRARSRGTVTGRPVVSVPVPRGRSTGSGRPVPAGVPRAVRSLRPGRAVAAGFFRRRDVGTVWPAGPPPSSIRGPSPGPTPGPSPTPSTGPPATASSRRSHPAARRPSPTAARCREVPAP
ncbi:hypothetical protein SHKM778_21810 [Streptomyces sp. KM77-8]|uniref:Serine protease n=1 Tax=Streptomyces haneummycinicus TaxID=3074435 RepID=A0AAT9HEP3_9ACTN